jgi:3-methyladenine DNA glycosylase AlkC
MPKSKPLSSKEIALEVARLKTLAVSEDWSTREEGGFGLRDLSEQYFEEVMALTQDWVTDANPYVQRAACLACMQRKGKTPLERLPHILARLEPLMAVDDLYVRKCCGPFVVGYLGYTYPQVTLPWLANQAKRTDFNVRANVAKAFSQALGKCHPEEGLTILTSIADTPHRRVEAAIAASLRNIMKRSDWTAPKIMAAYPKLAPFVKS